MFKLFVMLDNCVALLYSKTINCLGVCEMKQEEIQEGYLKIGFWFETTMSILEEEDLLKPGFAVEYRQKFYDLLGTEKEKFSQKNKDFEETIQHCFRTLRKLGENVSLTEIAKKYTSESPGYVIQSWMRSRNTLGFLRIWELINNYGFDDETCAKLLEEHANGDDTVTPTVWISRTKARGLKVKRGRAAVLWRIRILRWTFRCGWIRITGTT